MPLHQLRKFFTSASSPAMDTPVFAAPPGVRIYAVGDIHGKVKLLERMLEAIAQDAAARPCPRVFEIFLGDYVDRGPHSREVIDCLIAPRTTDHERICLMGNHEEALLRFLNDPRAMRDWANFGGYATLASYGIPIPEVVTPATLAELRARFELRLPLEHRRFLEQLSLSYQLGDYFFVHAGVMPGLPFEAQKPNHMLWIREPFLSFAGYYPGYVVHGHTPLEKPELKANRANIDVSGADIDSLCCLVIEGTERHSFVVSANRN
jgi:serine/threonine protein phosphatase 1